MMLYSIQRSKYKDIWPTKGSLFAEGRWNRAGQWVIYTSSTLSLAKLEILTNSPILPRNIILFEIELIGDPSIFKVDTGHLPKDWDKIPYPRELHLITEHFLHTDKSLLMEMPSVHSNREYNYLINPTHPDFESCVKLKFKSSAIFDSRLR